jgi:hypothetical protein
VGVWLILITSILTSLAMYLLSFFEVPRGVLKKLDYYRSRFFWQCDEHKKKYRLTKWSILCTPKEFGGLFIQNKCLLSKWLFKIINDEGVWQDFLKRKYLSNKTLTQVKKQPGDSHFWSRLMKVKDKFFIRGSFRIRNGLEVRFWEDTWIEDKPLKLKYPSLYNIVRRKDAMVAQVLSTIPLNVSF